jgi:aromatic ring-opening dioxygenase catalytic subunit (LigB family)
MNSGQALASVSARWYSEGNERIGCNKTARSIGESYGFPRH